MALMELLLVACLLVIKAQMEGLQQKSHFLSASVGDTITLPCFHQGFLELGATFYWYKQSFGMKLTLVANNSRYHHGNRLHGEFNFSKRFTLGHESNELQIKLVQMSDSAIYLCLACRFNQISILETFTVIVKTLDVQAEIFQPPHKDTEEGQSFVLKCSVDIGEECEGQHRVHWFRQSGQSAAGVLYSQGGGDSDQCQKTTKNSTKSCVYSLPIHNMSPEQAGDYYCAVDACGQVLFGSGTKVSIKDGKYDIIYILSGALLGFLVLVVVLGLSLCRMKKKYHRLSTELKCQDGLSAVDNGMVENQEDSLNYAALNILPASRRQRIPDQPECVYSGVQQDRT